jgi:hypothetical protein
MSHFAVTAQAENLSEGKVDAYTLKQEAPSSQLCMSCEYCTVVGAQPLRRTHFFVPDSFSCNVARGLLHLGEREA